MSPICPGLPAPRALPQLGGLLHGVRVLVLLGALTLLLVPTLFWLSPDWVAEAARDVAGLGHGPVTLDGRARALGALASLPTVVAALCMLWQLWRLFGAYAAGQVFTANALRHLGGFAHALLATALLTPVLRTGVGLAITWGNAPGQRALVISLSWHDYLALLLAAVLLAITKVMAAAVALAQENDGFV